MSRRLLTLVVPLALAGCFRDSQSNDDDVDSTGGESTGAESTLTTTISGSATSPITSSVSDSTSGDPTTGATDEVTTEATTDPQPTTTEAMTVGPTTDDMTSTTMPSTTMMPTSDTGTSTDTGDSMLTVPELEAGDLVITEIMFNPDCSFDNCEWFEILNNTMLPVDLDGLGLGDNDGIGQPRRVTTLEQTIIVESGALAVLTKSGVDWPYTMAEYDAVYGQALMLSNSSLEAVHLFDDEDAIIDSSHSFFGDNAQQGRSLALAPGSWDSISNDDSDNWCYTDTQIEKTNDYGTPGTMPVSCVVE